MMGVRGTDVQQLFPFDINLVFIDSQSSLLLGPFISRTSKKSNYIPRNKNKFNSILLSYNFFLKNLFFNDLRSII